MCKLIQCDEAFDTEDILDDGKFTEQLDKLNAIVLSANGPADAVYILRQKIGDEIYVPMGCMHAVRVVTRDVRRVQSFIHAFLPQVYTKTNPETNNALKFAYDIPQLDIAFWEKEVLRKKVVLASPRGAPRGAWGTKQKDYLFLDRILKHALCALSKHFLLPL